MSQFCPAEGCSEKYPVSTLAFYEPELSMTVCPDHIAEFGQYFIGLIEEGNAGVYINGRELDADEVRELDVETVHEMLDVDRETVVE